MRGRGGLFKSPHPRLEQVFDSSARGGHVWPCRQGWWAVSIWLSLVFGEVRWVLPRVAVTGWFRQLLLSEGS